MLFRSVRLGKKLFARRLDCLVVGGFVGFAEQPKSAAADFSAADVALGRHFGLCVGIYGYELRTVVSRGQSGF